MNISILIPTYKRSDLIVGSIKSCLKQKTTLPIEILIGDDSPDLATEKTVNSIEVKDGVTIRYYHNNPSLGQVANVDSLIKKSIGDKILLLHDDDELVENGLDILISCFEENSGIQAAFGKQYIMSNKGKVSIPDSEFYNKTYFRTSEFKGSFFDPMEAALLQQFPNNAFLIDSVIAKKVGYRDVGDACDYDFGLRAGKLMTKIHFEDQYVGKYRMSEISVTKGKNNDAGIYAYRQVEMTDVKLKYLKHKKIYLNYRSVVAVGHLLKIKDYKEALRVYRSKYYRNRILSKWGVKHTILLLLNLKSLFN